MSLYSARRLSNSTYRFVKFDDLFNPIAVYSVVDRKSYAICDCFQSNRPTCRHRQMLPLFKRRAALDSGRFYDYDSGKWYPPIRNT